MATYIQGLTDYIPQIQPFQPDYNFLGNILQTKQSAYDAAHKQLNNTYATLLDAPMLRDANIERRDQFFKAINQDIQKMSGMDLSLQQNQDAAMQVFKGFYEDKNMVKDMVWTKNLYNQMSKGDYLKSCADPDKCGGQWWEGGDKYLQYKAQEFKSASDSDALNFADVSYIPHINVTEKAIQAAKDAGFSVKMDTVKGGYIVTDKNGKAMQSSLADFYVSKFGNDPKVMEMYKAMSYVNRKDWVAQTVAQSGVTEDEANLQYVNNLFAQKEKLNDEHTKAQEKSDYTNNQKALMEKQMQKDGVSPAIDGDIINSYASLLGDAESANGATAIYKKAADTVNNMGINKNNIKALLSHVDDLAALAFLKREANNAATHYSNLTAEEEYKADPYSLATHNANLNLRNSMSMADKNYQIWEQKEVYKDKKLKETIDSIYGPDVLKANRNATGVATDVITSASKENETFRNSLVSSMRESQTSLLENYATSISDKYASATDLNQRKFYENAIKSAFANTGINVANLLKGDKAEIAKIGNMQSTALTKAFEISKDFTNPYSGTGYAAKDFFSKDFYNQNSKLILDATKSGEVFGQFESFFKNVATGAAERVKGNYTKDGAVDKNMSDLMDMYLDAAKDIGYKPFTDEQITAAWKGTDPEARAFINKFADTYARQHASDFAGGIYDTDPNSPTYGKVTTGYDQAKKFAYENSRKLFKDYSTAYDDYGTSYRKLQGMGRGSNANVTMAYEGYSDSDNNLITRKNTTQALEFLQDFSRLASDPRFRIAYGSAKSLPEGVDQNAIDVVNAYYTELRNPSKGTDDLRARGKWSAQMIAGDNPDYVGFTIYPSEAWAKKYWKGPDKDTPGLTGNLNYRNGITMFFPKDQVYNSFTQEMTASPYDYEFESTGKLSMNAFPDAKAEVRKEGNTKVIELTTTLIDEKGNPHPYVQRKTLGTSDLNNKMIVDEWMPILQELQNWVDQDKMGARDAHGTKDISALLGGA